MKNNTYFDELNRNACAWEQRHEAHNALKQQIVEEKGWDSEELKAWYEEEEEFPYSQGACKAYRAWKYSSTDDLHPPCSGNKQNDYRCQRRHDLCYRVFLERVCLMTGWASRSETLELTWIASCTANMPRM